MKKISFILFIIICIIQFLFPGKIDPDKIFENIKIYQIKDKKGFINYYLLPSEKENKQKNLIIYIDGSSTASCLGIKDKNTWKTATLTTFLRLYFNKKYDILVPDKYNIDFGKNYKRTDKKIMKYYTIEDRVQGSLKCIDEFLKNNIEYQNCYMLGISEGSIIMPKIYNNLQNKGRIKKIILCSHGGLSQYECFKIQYEFYNPVYKNDLKNIDKIVEDIKKNQNSLTKMYLGWPYKRWADFMFYKPINDIIKIDIPILVIHGDKDINAPVESSRFIKEEFDKKRKTNLSYKEYKDRDHAFNEDFEFLVKEIENWL